MMGARRRALTGFGCAIAIAFLLLPSPARAQQPLATPAQTPTSTQQKPAGNQAQREDGKQQGSGRQDRIFGVMPNYLTVDAGKHPPPLTAGTKFSIAAKTSFDPYAFLVAGVSAGIGQAEDSDPSWGQGLAGFGKRYGSAFATQAIGNFMKGAVLPSLLHQDPRYYRLGRGSFAHRFGYSLARIVITRGDSGATQFNYSRVGGDASAAAISNLYRAPEERTVSSSMITFGAQVATDAFGNEIKEFWPDIAKRFFHRKN